MNRAFEVAITEDGNRLYVPEVDSNSVAVIDTASNIVVASIPVGASPFGITVTPSANLGPTANAGEDQTVNEGSQGVPLDGSSSTSDVCLWEQVAGAPAVSIDDPTTRVTTFNAPFIGTNTTLTFRLTVTDDALRTDTDTVDATIVGVNSAPVADAGNNDTTKEGAPGGLDGSNSYDPEGGPLSFEWTQGCPIPRMTVSWSQLRASRKMNNPFAVTCRRSAISWSREARSHHSRECVLFNSSVGTPSDRGRILASRSSLTSFVEAWSSTQGRRIGAKLI